MNYIKHLTGFFDRIIQDPNLNPTHISLYMALFQFWNVNHFRNPISITREEIMGISKICSKATYHKCMRELNEKKYIRYIPSYNPFKGSMVVLFNFSETEKTVRKKAGTKIELPQNRQETGSKTANEQALVSSINNTNISNNSNLGDQPHNFKIHQALSDYEKNKIAKVKPALEEIKTYFSQQGFPEIEAQKFFNYFSSNGWLVGGKTPMMDWTAASQNWMLNANKFNPAENKTNRAKHLNTAIDKDYSEPL